MAEQAKADLAKIYDAPEDWLPGMTDAQKKDRLAEITYLDYLRDHVKAHPDALKFLQTTPNGNWGYGADAVGALDASVEFAASTGWGWTGASPTAASRPRATSCGRRRTTTSTTSPRATRASSARSCAS